MSEGNYFARFRQEQRARGRSGGPLDEMFARLANAPAPTPSQAAPTEDLPKPARLNPPITPAFTPAPPTKAKKDNHARPLFEHLAALLSARAPIEEWAQGSEALPTPAPAPILTPPTTDGPLKTVHDFTTERNARRAQLAEPPPPKVMFHPIDSLTACMNGAECPATSRRIFRVLLSLGLESVRARGVPVRPDVAVFHLPMELLAAHIQRDRVTVWRNLKPLIAAGVLAAVDHYGTLRGQNVVTGKVWAISLCPERILSGHAAPVKVTMADLKFPWRDLDRDVRQGRTAYALTRSEDRRAAEKARRETKAEQKQGAQARAEERRTARAQAKADGKVVPRGRAAATINAAATRAEKARAKSSQTPVQQSLEGLKAVERRELEVWVLTAFSTPSSDVTLTVAPAFSNALEAVFALPILAGLSRRQRGERVEKTARTLAAAFEDSNNLKFWCWLIWQTLRAHDQGQDWTDDVAHIMTRVLRDIQQDEQIGNRKQTYPAALVVNGLRNCGLLDALRQIERTSVGMQRRVA